MPEILPDGKIKIVKGDMLEKIYGTDWKAQSGYTGDPTKLQIGTILNAPKTNKALEIVKGTGTQLGGTQTTNPGVASSDQLRAQEQKKKDDQLKADEEARKELERLKIQKETTDLRTQLTANTTEPGKTDFEGEYKKLVNEKNAAGFNLGDYQTKVTDLEAERAKAEEELRSFRAKEPVGASNRFATGRISEAERAVMERVDGINRQIQTYSTQIKNRETMISNIMSLKKEDYANASQNYDRQFNKNLQIYNAVNGKLEKQKAEDEKQKDNARANLKIMQDEIQKGTMDFDSLPMAVRSQISDLELQAGFPQGFTAYVTKTAKGDVVSTSARQDAAGNEYFDVLTRGTDGSLKVTSIYKGKGRLPVGAGEDDLNKEETAFQKDLNDQIKNLVDDGDWATAYDTMAEIYGKKNPDLTKKRSTDEIRKAGGNTTGDHPDETYLDILLNKQKYY